MRRVLVAALALAPSAFAHAELFPNQIPSGDGYLLNLTVPNEKENASTTQIQITMPADFDLEHVAPVPGWTATVAGQHMVERRDGGRQLDHLEGQARAAPSSRCCRSPACPRRPRTTPSPCARPTPTAASSCGRATRARTRPPRTSRRRAEASSSGSSSDSSKTIADHRAHRRRPGAARGWRRARLGEARRHEVRRAGEHAARRSDGCAGAAGGGVGTRLAARDATAGERRALPTANPGATHLQRAHRAALRSHLGHGRPGQPGDGRQPGDRRPTTRTRSSSSCAISTRAGTSSGGA